MLGSWVTKREHYWITATNELQPFSIPNTTKVRHGPGAARRTRRCRPFGIVRVLRQIPSSIAASNHGRRGSTAARRDAATTRR